MQVTCPKCESTEVHAHAMSSVEHSITREGVLPSVAVGPNVVYECDICKHMWEKN